MTINVPVFCESCHDEIGEYPQAQDGGDEWVPTGLCAKCAVAEGLGAGVYFRWESGGELEPMVPTPPPTETPEAWARRVCDEMERNVMTDPLFVAPQLEAVKRRADAVPGLVEALQAIAAQAGGSLADDGHTLALRLGNIGKVADAALAAVEGADHA